jgi:nucleoside-diphosphate-sugar epimerase
LDGSLNFAASDTVPGTVILLGLGFTTSRLARRLLLRRLPVMAVVRNPSRYADLAAIGLNVLEYSPSAVEAVPAGGVVVHTVPPLSLAENEGIRRFIQGIGPRRVIYISSTGVYGRQLFVDCSSAMEPSEEKGIRRMEEELWLGTQAWSTLVLRPAAIYGPGRGIHVRLRDGKAPRAEGNSLVSRVHVDDLAAILELAVTSSLEGAWPVADHLPCSTNAIREWCAALLRLGNGEAGEDGIRISGRKVDAEELRGKLGVVQHYPGYPEGLLSSIAET